MLTRQEATLLRFIIMYLQEQGGVSPSFDEMMEAMKLKSKSGIHRLLTALEERGFIRRMRGRTRALEVLRFPQAACSPQRVAPLCPSDGLAKDSAIRPAGLPFLGAVRPGTPAASLKERPDTGIVDGLALGAGKHFVVELMADCMAESGILFGDMLVFRCQSYASDGDIVLAVVDGEVLVRRFRRRGRSVALEADSLAYDRRLLAESMLEIRGTLVAVVRRYAPALGSLASVSGDVA